MKNEYHPAVRVNSLVWFLERLREPDLMIVAPVLDVDADEYPLAVPIGRFRHGGCLEFTKKREAEKAGNILGFKDGFPDLRICSWGHGSHCLRWGEPVPFHGCDGNAFRAVILGLYYGYKQEALMQIWNHWKMKSPVTLKVPMR
jgi:hypothetical protein